MDIYDQLEQLVPQERKEDFLRLSRQLKEYGDHNPELLRIVEAMGFLSLYTEQLPKRVSDAIEHVQAQLTVELKALHAEHLSALRAFRPHKDPASSSTCGWTWHPLFCRRSLFCLERSSLYSEDYLRTCHSQNQGRHRSLAA